MGGVGGNTRGLCNTGGLRPPDPLGKYTITAIKVYYACTMIIVHVSFSTGLMFDEIVGGWSGGDAPRLSRGVWGAAGPQ